MLKLVLIVDAAINFLLGLLLLLFSPTVVSWLGVPPSSTSFYPNILGAVFIGITIALVISASGVKSVRATGLGVMGAISINLCGGTTLALWLIIGRLNLPTKGFVFLWSLVAILISVSTAELLRFRRDSNTDVLKNPHNTSAGE
jgi:hypothetical protein